MTILMINLRSKCEGKKHGIIHMLQTYLRGVSGWVGVGNCHDSIPERILLLSQDACQSPQQALTIEERKGPGRFLQERSLKAI